ncbi:transposase [Actinomadura madurae]|uniref:transposase n=1 Tax=Actinomadura madurae TaxID=1993 RepID=UPI0020D2385D|nr:transposase [Actinomadura madurae]MCP9953763.1 transposase [Actinomadura madurae]MCP9970518.1 transposase [Actinomadura madurae]MCP9982991.1 transposase [Actinomadura madurae]MCQ0005454.1 transposase [Actinomadura madurae]MCQ0019231.1 transposase [Actinomadura madurae]
MEHRLSLPVGAASAGPSPSGYRSRREWFCKSRRLGVLRDRLARARADRDAGIVHVVRGGRRLARRRQHLEAAQCTESDWRAEWESKRWFMSADGEGGKRYGNETIRVNPGGEVSIRLPAPLAHLANAPHSRYVLAARVAFAHRGAEWTDRIAANQAVAYRIHLDAARSRWYLTASWQPPAVKIISLEDACANGVLGVDANADHFAAWRLDVHGNPVGAPRRFGYDLSGQATHRDAQIRHAITRLLHWATSCGVKAVAMEDLDFAKNRTREKYGQRKRFRQLISAFPTGRIRVRLASMAAQQGLSIVVVDPAYTSRWGVQHWREPMSAPRLTPTRHDAASIAIGRRALGHPIRRRTAPPRSDQSDRYGHRTVQAGSGTRRREETRHPVTDLAPDARARAGRSRTRATSASSTVRDAPSARGRMKIPPRNLAGDGCSSRSFGG